MGIILRSDVENFLESFRFGRMIPNQPRKMQCFYNNQLIWETDVNSSGVYIKINKDAELSPNVLDVLNICGSIDMAVSIGSDSKNLSAEDWSKWFLEKITNMAVVVDTNFIIKHYFSSLITPKYAKEELKKISLYLPRMVVLEIERRGNDKREKAVHGGGVLEGKDRRLSFYAAKEIRDLRQLVDFNMIPLIDNSLMAEFTDRAGRGFSDLWIRKEIHDMIRHGITSQAKTLFITCDLMNSMAAEAEGLTACYFSALPQEWFNVNRYKGQFTAFFIANAIIFGQTQIRLVNQGNEVTKSFTVEGVWPGKTTSEWYADCLHFED